MKRAWYGSNYGSQESIVNSNNEAIDNVESNLVLEELANLDEKVDFLSTKYDIFSNWTPWGSIFWLVFRVGFIGRQGGRGDPRCGDLPTTSLNSAKI